MKSKAEIDEKWIKASIIGTIWAASEIVLGSFLHNLKVPFSGNILGKLYLEGERFVLACRIDLRHYENHVAKCGNFWPHDCHFQRSYVTRDFSKIAGENVARIFSGFHTRHVVELVSKTG